MTTIIEIDEISTGNKVPAEVRVVSDDRIMVMIRDYDTAKLQAVELLPKDGIWVSEDGKYQTDYEFDRSPRQRLIRVPKKPK